ncbi:MAG TPA: tetratricopeptide repeat protein [Gemmataceae bacterium]|jgi:Tfp pilus assembly protein PilF|nr:tetratricopeptide repeat protein [Gemmataceae bacterium]
MRRAAWFAGLVFCLGGCASTADERAQVYTQDGVYLFQAGKYAPARESFQAALALTPQDPALLYNLGQCHDRLGDAAQAERLYQECLQRAPGHGPCHHALAVLLVQQGRKPEATQLIAGWMAREPKRATPYAEDGWLCHQAGDLPRAQARLQHALELDPRDTRALTELALLYEGMHRPDRAIVLYERALEADPHQPDIAQRLAGLRATGTGRPHPE